MASFVSVVSCPSKPLILRPPTASGIIRAG